jgi:hypothetical protein
LVTWNVLFVDAFVAEFAALPDAVQEELIARARLLRSYGPKLGRPYVDSLNGSQYSNMKELRFRADKGVWRVAFAFDPARAAIVLVAGDKSGVNERLFYRRLITIADKRYAQHLTEMG